MKKGFSVFGFLFLSIFFMVGFFLTGLGVKIMNDTKTKAASYVETQGTVTQLITHKSTSRDSSSHTSRTSITYSPVYSYTVDGNVFTVTQDYSSNIVPEIGSTKAIKYNPLNPSEAIIPGFAGYHFLMIMGGIFLLVPTFIAIGTLKEAMGTSHFSANIKRTSQSDVDGYTYLLELITMENDKYSLIFSRYPQDRDIPLLVYKTDDASSFQQGLYYDIDVTSIVDNGDADYKNINFNCEDREYLDISSLSTYEIHKSQLNNSEASRL